MAELSRGDLNGVERRLSSLEVTVQRRTDELNGNIRAVSNQIAATHAELQKLKNDFERMMNEQRQSAVLQQASTELVTVRQEMERKFGNYSPVLHPVRNRTVSTAYFAICSVVVSQRRNHSASLLRLAD